MTLSRAPRSFLCECRCPFRFPRPVTAAASTPKRELSLANTMGEFDAGDRNGRARERLEPGHRRTSSLDRAVVLLDEVVEILVRPYLHVAPAGVFTAQQPQRTPARHMTVERHFAWNARRARGERLAKERLRGRDATVAAEQEINRLALLVDGAVELVPLRFDRDIRFVHSPRGADGFGEPAPALLELRHVAGYPTKNRRMGHTNTALRHYLDQVPVRKPIRDVAANAMLNNVGVKGTLAVDRVTGDRLCHSAPRAKDPAGYPMPLDAPEPCTHNAEVEGSSPSLTTIKSMSVPGAGVKKVRRVANVFGRLARFHNANLGVFD